MRHLDQQLEPTLLPRPRHDPWQASAEKVCPLFYVSPGDSSEQDSVEVGKPDYSEAKIVLALVRSQSADNGAPPDLRRNRSGSPHEANRTSVTSLCDI